MLEHIKVQSSPDHIHRLVDLRVPFRDIQTENPSGTAAVGLQFLQPCRPGRERNGKAGPGKDRPVRPPFRHQSAMFIKRLPKNPPDLGIVRPDRRLEKLGERPAEILRLPSGELRQKLRMLFAEAGRFLLHTPVHFRYRLLVLLARNTGHRPVEYAVRDHRHRERRVHAHGVSPFSAGEGGPHTACAGERSADP